MAGSSPRAKVEGAGGVAAAVDVVLPPDAEEPIGLVGAVRWIRRRLAAVRAGLLAIVFDPARKPDKRTVEVWHQGRRIEVARRVDVLANCFVKRSATTKNLQIPKGASALLPEGLAMRELIDGDDDKEIF